MSPQNSKFQRNAITGSARQIVIWILLAGGFGLAMAYRLFRSGASDFSYILAMSLAGVAAVAIVAPNKFSGKEQGMDEWSEETSPFDRIQKKEPGESNTIPVNDSDKKSIDR